MSSIFSKIVSGEISAYKIAETESHLAFLDILPVAKGHTLVIPKKQTDYIFDLTDDETMSLHLFAKKVAHAIKKVVPCKRIGMAVVGLEVPHAHIHLIPLNHISEMNFENERLSLSSDEFNSLTSKISQVFKNYD
jgi:histidine triad (HIT) family protein